MEAWSSPLVLTKLQIPAARPRTISRARLIDSLTIDAATGFILVSAPAGYGKTTLLTEWAHTLQKKDVAVAWVAIDPGDDAAFSFGAYLTASLIHALGPVADLVRVAERLRSSPAMDLQPIMPLVINAVVMNNRPCALILDDYHLIGSPAIHSAVAFLLEHLPENLRVAIGSRSDPPLPIARLRARGRLTEIRAASLRFTADETARFLNEVMHLDLPVETIAALETSTEGWAAGLQLAALSLVGRSGKEDFVHSFTGSHRYLVDYLLEEVVSRQPEEVQAFLLATSILERMCAPLCDAILGVSDHGEKILLQMEQANLFVVALDDQGCWYRYHHLFRDFLLARLLKMQPERIPELHRAASAWFVEHDFLREAAQHALRTRDWEYAAAFVEQHSFTMIIHSELSTIYEWCSAFPEEVMRAHPLLCILQCWGWVFSFRRQNHPKIEARLQQAEQMIATLKDGQLVGELREHAAIVRTFLAMSPDPAANARDQLVLAEKMMAAYPEGDPGRFSSLLTAGYACMALHDVNTAIDVLELARQTALHGQLYFGIVESSFHLARMAHARGQLRRAADICEQTRADLASMLAHPEQELPAVGCLDVALGCVLLEQDHLAEAEQALLHGLALMGRGMNPYHLMTACVALARLREIQGRPADAAEYLARLEDVWPDVAFCTQALRLMQALRTSPEDPGVLFEAEAWCQGFWPSPGADTPLPGTGPFGGAEAYYLANLTWIRARIAGGRVAEARPILDRLMDMAEKHGMVTRVIELTLLSTLARLAEHDERRARAELKRALAAAQPEGYMRIFDQRAGLDRLLVDAAGSEKGSDYIARIVEGLKRTRMIDGGHPGGAVRSAQRLEPEMVEQLTQRELEVLRLMAEGATNQAIAERFFITIGTVKSHTNHILGKLVVHNRTEAVAKARKLGLIDI